MSAFWIALLVVFIAELGDKTQIVALAFSTRFKPRIILLGITIASALTHLVSVAVGETASHMLPMFWIELIAGLFFLGFGFWTLNERNADDTKSGTGKHSRLGPLFSVAATFFLAEIGDKTMFATMALAAHQHNFFAVWLGSTLGMVLAGGLAVVIGKFIGRKLPDRAIKLAAAGVFLSFGVLSVIGAFTNPIAVSAFTNPNLL